MTTEAFARFIRENMEHNPETATIVRKVLRALKANGTPVTNVWDGVEETPVTTEQSVMDVVFNLDECHLYTAGGSWVFIVNGEGWDSLADYTTDLEDALRPVNDYIATKW